jgi:ABC-type multidrug transport system permease subunit
VRRFGIGLLCAIGGYVLGALVGDFLISTFSGNTHDRSVEAAMTSAFVVGPFAAVIAFVLGVVFARRKPQAS